MKFKVNDLVVVTGGKDKGKQAKIVKVLPKEDRVVVQGLNMYVKHIKPMQGRAGEKIRRERPLPTANIAIINPETGKVDRVGYKVDGDKKVRVFKKTGQEIK